MGKWRDTGHVKRRDTGHSGSAIVSLFSSARSPSHVSAPSLLLHHGQELRSASPDPPKAPPLFGNPYRKGKTAVDEADAGMEDSIPLNDGSGSNGASRSGSPQQGRPAAKRPAGRPAVPGAAPPPKR